MPILNSKNIFLSQEENLDQNNNDTNRPNRFVLEEADEDLKENQEEENNGYMEFENGQSIDYPSNRGLLQNHGKGRGDLQKFLDSESESDDSHNFIDHKNENERARSEQETMKVEFNNEQASSNLDYIMNYKKRALSDLNDSSEEQPKKKFLFSRKKLESSKKTFSVGISKGSDSLVYNDDENSNFDDELTEKGVTYHADDNSHEFSISIFKRFETLLKVLDKLKDLEDQERLVKLLPPKKFRLKTFLENYSDSLIIKYFDKLTDYQLLSLKRQYKSYYLKYKRFKEIQNALLNYKQKLTKLQEKRFEIVPFTPGCAPWNNGRKYLTINKHGVIWIETKTSTPIITFNAYDKSIRCNYRFEVNEEYDLAYLNCDGILLARSGYYNRGNNEIDVTGLKKIKRYVPLYFKGHKSSKHNNIFKKRKNDDSNTNADDDDGEDGDDDDDLLFGFEFNINVELLKGEYISTISISKDTINVFINSGTIKRYSYKTGFMTAIEKSYPVIASLGNDKILFNIHLRDPYSMEFLYSIKDVQGDREKYIFQNSILNISTKKMIENLNINGDQYAANLSTFEIIRGIFFNQNGNVCIVDNNEFLYVLLEGESDFTPILNVLEAFNDHNNSHDNLIYFPVSLTFQNLQVLIIKDISLEKKWNGIQNKINFSERQTQEILKEIDSAERLRKAKEKNSRKKKIQVSDVLKDDKQTIKPSEKVLTKREKINNDILMKNRNILQNKSSFILEQEKSKDVFSGNIYNFPGFPILPGLQNFKIKIPIECTQIHSRKTAFNDPRLLKIAKKESKDENESDPRKDDDFEDLNFNEKMDQLFGDISKNEEEDNNAIKLELNDDNKFNKIISLGDPDIESLETNMGFREHAVRKRKRLDKKNRFSVSENTGDSEMKSDSEDSDYDDYMDELSVQHNLRHDKNMLNIFNELVSQGRWKIAFVLVKNLQLNKSVIAATKVLEAHIGMATKRGEMQHKANISKFKKAIEAWVTKCKRNYRRLLEN